MQSQEAINAQITAIKTDLEKSIKARETLTAAGIEVPVEVLSKIQAGEDKIKLLEVESKFPTIESALRNALKPFEQTAKTTLNLRFGTDTESLEKEEMICEARLKAIKVLAKNIDVLAGKEVAVVIQVKEGEATKILASLAQPTKPAKTTAPKSGTDTGADTAPTGARGVAVTVNGVEYATATEATKALDMYKSGWNQRNVLKSNFDYDKSDPEPTVFTSKASV